MATGSIEKEHSAQIRDSFLMEKIKQILKEINRIDKLNQDWKEGKICEFEFSETLDKLLINLKRYQTVRKHRKKVRQEIQENL